MKWFRVWLGEIKSFEVVKETEKQLVYINPQYVKLGINTPLEQRTSKHSQYENWFSTFAEARQFLLDGYDKRVASLQEQIVKLTQEIEKTKAMTGPANE